MIKIVLADDHQVVRKGFKALLSVEPDFKIVGEAGDGFETVKLVEQLQPDILVLDLMMGIVILSMHSNEAYVLEALRSGARSYILKESPPEELIKAINEVYNGRRYLSAPLTERAIEAYTQKTEVKTVDPYDQLTTREREILQLAAQGHTNNEIAAHLYISPRTVETHRTNLMHKLGLHNHAQLIQYAFQRGLIPSQA